MILSIAIMKMTSSTDEEENNLNASRRRKRMRLLTDSEDDTEESNERQNTETAVDGKVWKKIETRSSPGRSPVHTIFKDVSGPSGHTKRNVMSGKVSTAFYLVFDNNKNKRLPETIKFYNSTQFEVDMTDQMAKKYSVKCKCRRWPMHVFYNILNLADINLWVLYKETTGENISRKDFLFQLGEELAAEYKKRPKRPERPSVSCKTTSFPSRQKKCQIKHCSGNRATGTYLQCKKYACGKCLVEQPLVCKNCGIE